MIRTLGTGNAELEIRMNDLIEFLEALRIKKAAAWSGLIENMRSIAGSEDVELAKAIAEALAMLGEPAQFRQAAE